MVDEPRTKFTAGIFSTLDSDDNGRLNFDEFVTCVCHFVHLTKAELLKFCFDMFDVTDSGILHCVPRWGFV